MGMRNFVIRRVLHMGLTLWAFVTILFVLFRLLPGDPTTLFAPLGMSQSVREQRIAELGLDRPLHVQYVDYVAQLLTGDLGQSYLYREPVLAILTERFLNTVFLMIGSLLIAYTFGILVGSLLAWKRGTKFESLGIVGVLVARSSPQFWIGIVLVMVFSFWLEVFPPGGMRTPGASFTGFGDKFLTWDFVWHLFLPMLTGAIYFSAAPTLLMRNTMLEILNSDFIQMKKAEGLSNWRVLYLHATRNSLLPIVTLAAIVSGIAMGGMLLIEVVFNWPGMGREMVRAISHNDYPVAMGAFFLMGVVVMTMNFVADVLYAYLDPRVTYD